MVWSPWGRNRSGAAPVARCFARAFDCESAACGGGERRCGGWTPRRGRVIRSRSRIGASGARLVIECRTEKARAPMARINPFRPNSPVAPGMFVGRLSQLEALEAALLQTRAGRSKSFMLTGERGIGKTSLLQYFKWVAQGHINIQGERMNFLVVELDLDASSTDLGLIRRVELGLQRELAKGEPARSFLSTGWDFLKRVQALGVSVRDGERITDPEVLHDEFAHSLALTANRTAQADAPSVFGSKYDGIILLLDEADNAPRALRLGALLKLLVERVERHGCGHLMIGLAGMPALREHLRESHASSLRIFDELPLETSRAMRRAR